MLGEGRRVPTAALQSLTSPVTRPPAQLESPATRSPTRSSRTDPRHPPAEPRLAEKTLSGVACSLFRLCADGFSARNAVGMPRRSTEWIKVPLGRMLTKCRGFHHASDPTERCVRVRGVADCFLAGRQASRRLTHRAARPALAVPARRRLDPRHAHPPPADTPRAPRAPAHPPRHDTASRRWRSQPRGGAWARGSALGRCCRIFRITLGSRMNETTRIVAPQTQRSGSTPNTFAIRRAH